MAYRIGEVLIILFGAGLVYGIVGAELFWGSLIVAVGATYLSGVPFIWIPLGLMVIGGLLTEPIVFIMLVVGFGCAFEWLKRKGA